MKLIFQLSGEHPDLPIAELFSVLNGEHIKYKKLYHKDRTLILNIKTKGMGFVNRLAMTTRVASFIHRSDNIKNNIKKIASNVHKKISGSFRINSTGLIEKRLGREIHRLGHDVNLKNPDNEIICLIDGSGYIVGINIPLKRDFNKRKPQYRPFFHPTSIHPKIARVLVNLSRVRSGDTLLDPFCGTGGILIEAGLIGLKVIGYDIDNKMVSGCRENLQFYGLTGNLKQGDALRLRISRVDAIVTDPPYGRSSFTTFDIQELYSKFITNAKNLLKSDRYMVIVLPDVYEPDFKDFKISECYDIKVHKSLTRRIWVVEN